MVSLCKILLMQTNRWKSHPNYLLSRVCARLIDYCLLYFAIIFISIDFFPALFQSLFIHIVTLALIPLLWVPFEILFLIGVSTTPGKALFGMSVVGIEGKRLGFFNAFRRATAFWFQGLICNLPPLNLCALALQGWHIKKEGKASWEKKSLILYREPKWVRRTTGLIGIFLTATTLYVGFQIRDFFSMTQERIFTAQTEGLAELPEQWHVVESADKTYSIAFPAEPTANTTHLPIPKSKDTLPYEELHCSIEESGYTFNVSHTVLPAKWLKWSNGLVLKGALKFIVGYIPDAKIVKVFSNKFKTYPSLEFRLKKGEQESAGRLVLVKNRLYKIEVSYPVEKREEMGEVLDRFISSFEPAAP